jgi:uncharacterized membrane protein
MRPSPGLVLVAVASVAGLVFAGFSTHDFVQHLDREVHSITCSFVPGLAAADATGSSGCHATLMSPYSSVLRKAFWGGIPISLAAMSVFAFLLFRALDAQLNRRPDDRTARGFLLAATLLPVLSSVVMGGIAFFELSAACKLCIGIYAASALAFVGALLAWREAGRPFAALADEDERPQVELDAAERPSPAPAYALAFGQGVGFVAVPIAVYVAAMPAYDGYVGTCGELIQPEDKHGVLIDLDGPGGADKQAIELVDPLCPSCRSFEHRLDASGLGDRLDRKGVLFPLDSTCNWMVSSAMHPGACALSEAVLCAGDQAHEVMDWAFAQQDALRAAAATDPAAPAAMAVQAFPALAGCVGKPAVKAKLNNSLRWAVKNQLPVLTPQLFVEGRKLCDADTDLGMDYALSRLVDQAPTGATP